jgi:putative DNA methylase
VIETALDPTLLASLALREKQIQQNYRPVIAVHKWFARRPGALFRGLILAEFADGPLNQSYYSSHSFQGRRVLDPFMGGGTPVIEANRLGCDVLGLDINPMAYWIVREEIEELSLPAYRESADALLTHLSRLVGDLYATSCTLCGASDAPVKYFLWVKVQACRLCEAEIRLFPGPLLARAVRHPRSVLVCLHCGSLNEVSDPREPGHCSSCSRDLATGPVARRNTILCPHCGASNHYPANEKAPPRHRMFALEYHCPNCARSHKGRFFKTPDDKDIARYALAEERYAELDARFIPDDYIPPGDETDRLHRWGYSAYREMFNLRQLLALEHSARLVTATLDDRVRRALATNFSDLLRYQNMLCRYDTMALKSLDIFSVHGFPVGLIQCESNILGIKAQERRAGLIGSGGWLNIITKYATAKAYCNRPFEAKITAKGEHKVFIEGETIGYGPSPSSGVPREVVLAALDAAKYELPDESLDGVFTDPPYLGNVQYAELMDFCYVWLRRLLAGQEPAFSRASTRSPGELTGNFSMGRDIESYTEGLSTVFGRVARALKPQAPLAFTFHHNYLYAYSAIAVAILDSHLVCSMSMPLPAEMGASIHISGTGSSVVDTVFVCRKKGKTPRRLLAKSPRGVATLIRADLIPLEKAGLNTTAGDLRCIAAGHLTRLAIWHLRSGWLPNTPTREKITKVSDWIANFGGIEAVLEALSRPAPPIRGTSRRTIMEPKAQPYDRGPLIAF